MHRLLLTLLSLALPLAAFVASGCGTEWLFQWLTAANGIRIALPTVTVAGGAEGDAATAAAQKTMEMVQPAAP